MTARRVEQPAAADYGAMPETDGLNFYLEDPNLAFALKRYLTAEERMHADRILREAGEVAGGELNRLAFEANAHPPVLEPFDRQGQRVNRVLLHPAYRAMERIAFERFGLAAVSHHDGVLGWPGRMPPVMKYALSYVLVQAEFGLFCPVNMTDSAARTIALFGDEAVKAATLPRLTALDLDSLAQGAQFLTEREGGSDVGASRLVARQEGDCWRLYGEKWFCSNAGAALILTLARPEGAPEGTRGLGLFLVEAELPDGSPNGLTINRLKEKLGSRSMATGEYTFHGALARPIGRLDRGFHQMMEMVNASRISNSMRAVALMRRSYLESLVHARGRMALGRPLAELPLMRQRLLEMLLDVESGLAVVLQMGAALGRADAGSQDSAKLIRILTPLAKWYLCKRARWVTGEGMEIRGGNGYIEEWVNPRLVRDSHLGSIWKGASNVMLLDVARAIEREGSGAALLDDLWSRLRGLRDPNVALLAETAVEATERMRARFAEFAAIEPGYRELALEPLARRLFHLNAAALLLEEADAEAVAGNGCRKLLLASRYQQAYLARLSDEQLMAVDRSTVDWFDPLVNGGRVPLEALMPSSLGVSGGGA